MAEVHLITPLALISATAGCWFPLGSVVEVKFLTRLAFAASALVMDFMLGTFVFISAKLCAT